MPRTNGKTNSVVALVVACSVAARTLAYSSYDIGPVIIVFIFPGILGSMAFSGNVHAFHLWIAALVNFAFYFLLCWTAGVLARRISSVLARKIFRRRNDISEPENP